MFIQKYCKLNKIQATNGWNMGGLGRLLNNQNVYLQLRSLN